MTAVTGPIVGGWLLSAAVAYPWGCYVFAGVAAVGAIAVSIAASPAADDSRAVSVAETAEVSA